MIKNVVTEFCSAEQFLLCLLIFPLSLSLSVSPTALQLGVGGASKGLKLLCTHFINSPWVRADKGMIAYTKRPYLEIVRNCQDMEGVSWGRTFDIKLTWSPKILSHCYYIIKDVLPKKNFNQKRILNLV